ncbi:MAG TPA: hypothetical protein DDW94_08330 [Deltaproteobacteria bacterium]|nr:MAG: hypothetical protein A2Z79_02855 [Deltaproteobacteria bacterium GWA2_55_82]OGQ64314.1 MAG: hypothetical protein A3I81_04285 [Deltaproteobacteria bacterium RIFCSPLOWO2_02_FULL_55_12]OIJ74340.1 MAG: hypothetical protein A2V21_308755 [Deltaproteobacteria bacterium GWC2_55_46]HBG46981.1 hypothetical protein [Deltaproteobacteria bacterium]HCY10959.1 hypothetical protein [Deltaproteobacteria bacterium]
MKVTPLEIRSHGLRKSFKGYEVKGVEELREVAAEALEEASREIIDLKEKLSQAGERIKDYASNEHLLRETITTAQKLAEDLKANARKEAELLIVEAKLQAEETVRQAQARARDLQDEIYRLRKQRREIEASVKAIIDYHSATLLIEEEESKKADEESDKLKFLTK